MPMTGEYQHSLDAKGRIFIPARLRDELGSVFYVTLSSERCTARAGFCCPRICGTMRNSARM